MTQIPLELVLQVHFSQRRDAEMPGMVDDASGTEMQREGEHRDGGIIEHLC